MSDEFLLIAVLLAAFGVVLPILLARSRLLVKAAEKLPPLSDEPMKLVRCDCGPHTKCPQGRDPMSGGNPYRCHIWKAE